MRLGVLLSLCWMGALGSCGAPPNDRCRFTPERCQGGPGGFCATEADCATEVCCDKDECGGGMCTFTCKSDSDCPSPMRCQGDFCFYDCVSDGDCAEDMECRDEKEEGVCQHAPDRGRPER